MREILFRGKRLDNQEWVEGNLLLSETPVSGMPLAFITISFIDNYSLNNYQVDPTTVGQFTGLTDKNGVKIFEGDILTTGHLGFSESVTFENGCFQLKTNKEQGVSILVQDRAARLTISGNIYTL